MFGFGVSDLHLLMHRLRIVCISRTAFQALASAEAERKSSVFHLQGAV